MTLPRAGSQVVGEQRVAVVTEAREGLSQLVRHLRRAQLRIVRKVADQQDSHQVAAAT
jgi:hypothetical protein